MSTAISVTDATPTALGRAASRLSLLFTATAALSAPFAVQDWRQWLLVVLVILTLLACTVGALPAAWLSPVLAGRELPQPEHSIMIIFLGAVAATMVALAATAGALHPDPAGFVINWLTVGMAGGLTLGRGTAWGLAAFVAGLAPALLVTGLTQLSLPPATVIGPLCYLIGTAAIRVADRRGFAATRSALAAAQEAETTVQVADERWRAARADERRLHDTVLATLTLLAHRGEGVSAAALRQACTRDAEFLRSGRLGVSTPAPTVIALPDEATPASTVPGRHPSDDSRLSDRPCRDADVLLEELLIHRATAAGLIGLEVRTHLAELHGLRLDPTVGDAVGDAVGECLENVRRHAGVGAADLTVLLEEDSVSVIVVDEGRGFDPAQLPPDHLGLRASVQERLESVGGQATVWSGIGRGTSVLLTVPVQASPVSGDTSPSQAADFTSPSPAAGDTSPSPAAGDSDPPDGPTE